MSENERIVISRQGDNESYQFTMTIKNEGDSPNEGLLEDGALSLKKDDNFIIISSIRYENEGDEEKEMERLFKMCRIVKLACQFSEDDVDRAMLRYKSE